MRRRIGVPLQQAADVGGKGPIGRHAFNAVHRSRQLLEQDLHQSANGASIRHECLCAAAGHAGNAA
jgi:hypothetical protein